MNTDSVAGKQRSVRPEKTIDCSSRPSHWRQERTAPTVKNIGQPVRDVAVHLILSLSLAPEVVHACTRAYSGFSLPIIRTQADCSLQQVVRTIQVTIHETANRDGAAERQARFCSVTRRI